MRVAKMGLSLVGGFFVAQVLAMPPYEVMRSCRDEKALNKEVIMENLKENGGSYADTAETGCNRPYEIYYKNTLYGAVTCGDNDYLLVRGLKIPMANAIDVLKDPYLPPFPITQHVSNFYHIKKSKESYLCVVSPVSESGIGAAQSMYYIVENAFDTREKPIAYFYFFGFVH